MYSALADGDSGINMIMRVQSIMQRTEQTGTFWRAAKGLGFRPLGGRTPILAAAAGVFLLAVPAMNLLWPAARPVSLVSRAPSDAGAPRLQVPRLALAPLPPLQSSTAPLTTVAPSSVSGPPVAGASLPPVTSAPAPGLFQELPSADPVPSVTVTTDENDVVTVLLLDSVGRSYYAVCSPGVPATIQIPAGQYSVQVSSNDPDVLPNTGDALFRPYRKYSARFYHGIGRDPIHLGE